MKATNLKITRRHTKDLSGIPGNNLTHSRTSKMETSKRGKNRGKCSCCGRNTIYNTILQCWYKKYSCNTCNNVGHLSYNCKNRKTNYMSKERADSDSERGDDDSTEELDESFNRLYHLKNVGKTNKILDPIKLKIQVENKTVEMELDTGTSVSIISERDYNANFKKIKVKNDGLRLQYYTKETVETMGYIKVNVKYNNKEFKVNCYIMKGAGPMLIGREWIGQMDILPACQPKIIKIQNILNILNVKHIRVEQQSPIWHKFVSRNLLKFSKMY